MCLNKSSGHLSRARANQTHCFQCQQMSIERDAFNSMNFAQRLGIHMQMPHGPLFTFAWCLDRCASCFSWYRARYAMLLRWRSGRDGFCLFMCVEELFNAFLLTKFRNCCCNGCLEFSIERHATRIRNTTSPWPQILALPTMLKLSNARINCMPPPECH